MPDRQHEKDDPAFFRKEENGEETVFFLQGDWTILNAAAIESALDHADVKPDAMLDLSGIEKIDTAGAWLIRKYFPDAEAARPLSEQHQKLFDFLPEKQQQPPPEDRPGTFKGVFIDIGRGAEERLGFLYEVMCFTGIVASRFFKNILSPRHFRFPAIVRHIQETGLQALPIIGLLAFLMSMVVSYQAALQLQKFGADIFTIDLTVISLLREMGVLVTAIMVAGRSGSAFAAEIGVMKLREEVDALRVIGLDPIETLVLPRMLALIITLPLLTFFADIIGLAGGSLMANLLLDIPFTQYIDRVEYVATPELFFVGMIKAPVFAILISIICTYQGMHVTGSAESVGRLTTVAVVQSIFLVIMADALFSIIFAEVGL